jgi:DNA replication protein DnaC
LSVLERWSPQRGNLVLSAPTGRGKTAGLVAWAARAHASESAPVIGFVSGLELAGARRRARLGEEAETVERALRCDVLFLDELGFEPAAEEPFLVIDSRYRAGHPTVVTTGLRPAAFRERYGDALWRRLAEGGAVVEDFQAGAGT